MCDIYKNIYVYIYIYNHPQKSYIIIISFPEIRFEKFHLSLTCNVIFIIALLLQKRITTKPVSFSKKATKAQRLKSCRNERRQTKSPTTKHARRRER